MMTTKCGGGRFWRYPTGDGKGPLMSEQGKIWPICCYCDNVLSCAHCGKEQPAEEPAVKPDAVKYPCRHELSEDCGVCMQEEIGLLRAELAQANERTQSQIDQANEHFRKMEAAGHAIEAELWDVRATEARLRGCYDSANARAEEAIARANEAEAQLTSARKALEKIAALVESEDGEPLDEAIAIANRALTDDVGN